MDGGLKLGQDEAARMRVRANAARTSLEDVFNGYRLFLGRHPSSLPELTAVTNATFPEFLSHYLMRGEFLNNVIDRLGGDAVLPHIVLAAEPDEALARWTFARLPLSDDTKSQLTTSRSWRFWLLSILRDATFRASLPAEVGDWLGRSGLAGRLSAIELAPTRQLIGEASHSGAGTILGWCANARDFSERVVLELSLGGRFIGAVRCEHFVPGLGERIGGAGEHGFSFEIPSAYAELAARGAMLRICDAHSKAPFGGEIYIKTNLPAALDELGRMLAAINSVKDLLAKMERQLPHTLRHISPPLSAYGNLKAQGLLACHHVTAEPETAINVNVVVWESALNPLPLRHLLSSLKSQSHTRWTLTVLATDTALGDEIHALLRPLMADSKAMIAPPDALPRLIAGHPHIAGIGAHLIVGCAGTLRPDALAVFLAAMERGSVAYSDHDLTIDARNGHAAQSVPVFKPDFDPVLLLAYDYLGPIVMAAPEVLLKAFAITDGAPPSCLHDLMLRLVDCVPVDRIQHIASMLYSLHQSADLHSIDSLPRLLRGSPAAVEAWAGRRNLSVQAHPTPLISDLGEGSNGQILVEACLVEIQTSAPPSVSVIVPTRNAPILLRNCLDSLLRTRDAYPGKMQILVIDHENEDPDSVSLIAAMQTQRDVDVLPYRGPFNWAQMNNLAAVEATGEVLVFLNDDTMAADHAWLSRAVATLSLPGVGVVGARLLYGDGSIQHAGVVTSVEQGAVHEAIGVPGTEGGYLGRNLVLRSAAAVTGACLITSRAAFEKVGGYDPTWPINWNDIIYCLAARKAGWRVVYDPAVCLYHHESKTRGYQFGQAAQDVLQNDLHTLRREWGNYLNDPFHNPAFNRISLPFTRMAL